MSESVNISHLITAVVTLFGWIVGHRFSAWRDRINHRRTIQTEFLVSAFQHLAISVNRPFVQGAEHLKVIESALADIQLFGSKKQVEMVEAFAIEFARVGSASLDPLLNSLRQNLRKELGYEPINNNVRWVRFEGGENAAQPAAAPKG